MKRINVLFSTLLAAIALAGCSVVATGGGTPVVQPSVTPSTAPSVAPGTGAYLYSTAGTVDIANSIDNWGSGTGIDPANATQSYNPCISANSGTGWGDPATAVAFTGITAGKLAEFKQIKFKIKSTSYTSISIKIPGTQKDGYLLTDGTDLGDGWIQMSIPVSDFDTAPLTATELAILNNTGAGSFYLTDVCMSGTADVDVSGLTAAITAANTLNSDHPVGTANGNVPAAAKTSFTDAITAAQAVANSTITSQNQVIAAVAALTTATTTFKASIIVIGPSTLAPDPVPAESAVISLFNSSEKYSNISGITWNPGWGQGGSLTDTTVAGKTIKLLALKTNGTDIYQGVDFSGNLQDISSKNTLHISYWTTDATDLNIYPINTGGAAPHEYLISAGTLTKNAWAEIDITINQASFDLTTIQQLKFTASAAGNLYLDNIYFH